MILNRTSFIALLLLPGALAAQVSINWGSGFATDNIVESNGTSYASTGNGFTYEIGTFGSFTPTASNIDQWAANWHVFDGGPFFYNSTTPTGWYYGSAQLNSSQNSTSTYAGADNSYTFGVGQQAYVWVYNDNDYANIDTTTEWALYTNLISSSFFDTAWQMPNASGFGVPRTWFVTNADTAVWGGVDSGADVGAGNIIQTPSTYHVQTAGFTAGVYWDLNGSNPGAIDSGTTAPGTWNSSNTNWSNDPDGNIATGAFTQYKVATFSANDGGTGAATGSFDVDKVGATNVYGLDFQEGTVTITHGSGGLINFDTNGQTIAFNDGDGFDGLVNTAFINVHSSIDATIETAIASNQNVNLTGGGSLTLAGSQTGEIDGTFALLSGALNMEGTGTNPRLGFNSGGKTTIDINGGSLIVSETTPSTDVQFGSTTDVIYRNGSITLNNVNESLGTLSLTLDADSTIDFTGDTTDTIIHFADSSAIDWSTSETLLVTNWAGIPLDLFTGVGGGGTDQFHIGTDSSGITSAQLSKIKFVNPFGLPAGIYDAYIMSSGEIVPGVIPEPSTYIMGGLLILLGGFDFYRRCRAKR